MNDQEHQFKMQQDNYEQKLEESRQELLQEKERLNQTRANFQNQIQTLNQEKQKLIVSSSS